MVAHPTEELGAYAIGALERGEAAKVEDHLRSCDSCRAELEEYERTTWRLAETGAAEPPGRLRAAVVGRARAERPARGGLALLVDLIRRPVPLLVPAALVAVLVIALAGYAGARRDADRYAAALAGVPNGRVVALAPSAERPQARGALVQPRGGDPYLILDLPATPGKTWQAWVIRGDEPLPAGTSGDASVIFLTVPLRTGDIVAVTQEVPGGASKPTSAPVLTTKVG